VKNLIIAIIVLAVVAGGLVVAFKEMSKERAREADAEQPVGGESRVHRGKSGEVIIALTAEEQARLALKVASPATASLPREVRAYGRVLDPSPLAAQVAEIATAGAALEASRKESQRLKSLFDQGQNASGRAVETAQAAFERDQVAYQAVQFRLASAWGKALTAHPGLPGLVQALIAQENALVRLDLPAGERIAAPQGARLFTLDAPDQAIEAGYLGAAADVDPQAQGLGFLFLVKAGDSGLRPGQAVVGQIRQPGEPLTGVLVPASAVIRAVGKAWVYAQTAETEFTRREIPLEHPAAGGWLVTKELGARDRLVIAGAQMLFSEEQKSRIQVGD
jgi:hypothetical protein